MTTGEVVIYSSILLALVTLVTGASVVNNTLRCYQCEIAGQEDIGCHENDLRLCPSNQAYDRCITNYRKNVSGHFIIKKCALAPCTFRTREVDSLFSTDCELDWSTNDCVKCCPEDGCNRKNSSTGIVPQVIFTIFLFSIVSLWRQLDSPL